MKKYISSFLFALSALLFISCQLNSGSGYGSADSSTEGYTLTDKKMDLPSFHGVNNSCSADVRITKGSSQSVEVDAPSGGLDKYNIEVEKGILKIWTKRNVRRAPHISLTIVIPEFDYASVTGSGDIIAKGFDTAEELTLRVTGSGNVDVECSASSLQARITGSGKIKASGSANDGQVGITGSGTFQGEDFPMKNVDVNITGSGDAHVHSTGVLDGRITGSGDVHGYGDHSIKLRSTGSGKYRS